MLCLKPVFALRKLLVSKQPQYNDSNTVRFFSALAQKMNEPPATRQSQWRQEWQRCLRQGRSFVRRSVPFASGVVATLVALLLYNRLFPPPAPLTSADVNDTIAQTLAEATPAPAYSSLVYQMIRPSLVLIQVQTTEESSEEEGGSLGSGVVVNNGGEILTSLHVVTNSLVISVTFADGTESMAQIVAAVPENDIAVLLPTRLPEVFAPAILGNPRAMNVGDEAFAVGHPLGLYASLSAGVISGFERSFQPPDGGVRLEGLIQIDAAVNPGNSGGLLLNRNGEVIGIVTGLANPTDENFFIGIGFAVPINVAGGAAGLPPY
jgi:S1-C subfamily serine protease